MTNEWFGVITEVRYDAGPGDDNAVILGKKYPLELDASGCIFFIDEDGEKPESVSFSCAIELPVREYDSFEFDANGSCVSCRLVNPEVARLNAAPVQQVSVTPHE